MSGAFGSWRRGRALKRVRPGDGRILKRFRWWQALSRSLFYLRITGDNRNTVYAVDVRHAGDATTGDVTASLYLDGRQHSVCRLPAVFPVPGGTIEVSASTFGLKRCHYVPIDGVERQLVPDARSAEGHRAHFDHGHPGLSRLLGIVTLIVLIIGLAILIPQIVGQVSQIPPIAGNIGKFTPPIQLSVVGNIVVTLVTGAASTERALRLRYNALLDGGAG